MGNPTYLILGQILAGFASGDYVANVTLILPQYSSAGRHGFYLSIEPLLFGVGIMLVYVLGALVNYRVVAGVLSVLTLVSAVWLCLVPESPIWLLGHRSKEDARKALQWLRDRDDVASELEDLEEIQDTRQEQLGLKKAITNLRYADIRKPFFINIFNGCLVFSAGPLALFSYAVQIFQDLGLEGGAYVAAIILAAVRIIGAILAIFVIKKFPRARVACVCVFIMGICMAVLGCLMYFKTHGNDSLGVSIGAAICIFIYMFAYCTGVISLLVVWVGELMPPEYNVLVGFIEVSNAVFIFLSIKMFSVMLDNLQTYGTFWLYAGISFALTIFYMTKMPETKGMSILEIRNMFLQSMDSEYQSLETSNGNE